MRKAMACLLLWGASALCATSAHAQLLYGEDLVKRIASPSEIREATTIRGKLRKESKQAEALFVLAARAFDDIETAPNTQKVVTKRPKQWYLPPWDSLDPALPAGLPEDIRKEYEGRRQGTKAPDIWAALELQDNEIDKTSALLVPRAVQPGEELIYRIKEIPAPFSLRRYFDGDQNVFVQLAAFGGTSSFSAEEAYRGMKEAATRQEPIEGIGTEAFMTRVVVIDEATRPVVPDVPLMDGPAMPVAPPFADIEPNDEARPELTDSGRAAALGAPAFNDLAVADLEGKKIAYPAPPKKYFPKGGEIKQSVLVIVAFFPDEAVTLSFAIEERMGTVQDLVAVAILAQRKLREDIAHHG